MVCLVVGDSVAVGVSQQRPDCISYSKVGISSPVWNRDYLPRVVDRQWEAVIISLGGNDQAGVTESELMRLRVNLGGKRVFWISPGHHRKPEQSAVIDRIAKYYGDVVLVRPLVSSDGVHPTAKGYKILAEQTK